MVLLAALLSLSVVDAKPPVTEAERLEALDAVYERFDFGFPKVDEIDAAQLRERLASERETLVLVDVRPEDERKVSILPGAISLEDYEARREADPTAFADQTVVTYCTVGVRSGFAANKLRKEGVDVLNFKGSILGWTHADGPLVTPAGEPTRQVHVYGKRWDFAADGYEPVITDREGVVEPAR
jgi:rhodanese-related sulfurtransferase